MTNKKDIYDTLQLVEDAIASCNYLSPEEPVQVLNKARAHRSLFKRVHISRDMSPINIETLTKKLVDHYELSGEDRYTFEEVGQRLGVCVSAIDSVKQQYGVNRQGNIVNKRELYESVYGRESPKAKQFYVTPHPFALCFYLPNSYFKRNKSGDTSSVLDNPLDYLISYGDNNEILNALIARIRRKDIHEPIHKKYQEEITFDHELKHIIDKIISPVALELIEVSANLYCGKNIDEQLIQSDLESVKEVKDYLNQSKPTSSHDIFEEAYQSAIDRVASFPLEALRRINKNGVSRQTLSFIVSTANSLVLNETLLALDKYMQENPHKAIPL